MEEIEKRLAIFKGADIITEDDYNFLYKWHEDLINSGYNDEEKLARIVTHLSMMLKRLRDNEELDSPINDIETLKEYSHFNEALVYLDRFKEKYNLYKSEEFYIMIHLLNLME